MKFHCCDPLRLEVLRRSSSANAIDFLEVLDKAAPATAPRQETLLVRLLRTGFSLTKDNLRITGGERIRDIGIVWCAPANALPPQAEPGLIDTVDDPARTLVIRTDSAGDYSTYTLSIVASSGSDDPPDKYDPRLSQIEFSFKVECPADYDCAQPAVCGPDVATPPDIDYLAKDYQGFRRLMLDRLSLLVPDWTERSAADLGVTLVELLAYAADNLSYRQDSIANEAYLATARQRVSVRRHARLVDYLMHEGCNARVFVHFEVQGVDVALDQHTPLLTRVPGLATEIAPDKPPWRDALAPGVQVFETAHAAVLNQQLNRLSFYTWGDAGCCLTRGATQATLRGHLDRLKVGDILVFEEVASPTTFKADDADHGHRWAVRLTAVTFSTDPSGQLFDKVPVDGPVDVTEIAWDAADALPFPLCVSVKAQPGLEVSIALGNNVLADHGLTFADEALGEVPPSTTQLAPPAPADCCDKPAPKPVPPRFRPALQNAPLSHGFDLGALLDLVVGDNESWWPATSLLAIDPRSAMPLIAKLEGTSAAATKPWTVRRDLLASKADDADFVVEVENSGRARLRFGDDEHGTRPTAGTTFAATYRVGNGVAGNVGAEAIAHVVRVIDGAFTGVRNPMAAAGGVEPEDIEAVRRDAPQAFRTQQRAVTPKDYAAAAERRPDVQRAAATFRWTGSWYTVFVTPDRFGGRDIDPVFKTRLRGSLERYRMAGYDLEVSNPRFVPLDIGLHVCVKDDYFRADVLHAVGDVLSSGVRSDGTRRLFHPDNFSFGQPVYLSPLIAAAQAVEGVDSIRVDLFQRMIAPSPVSLLEGVIGVGALEIAELANNPNFRERGRLTLAAGGGK